MIVPFLWVLIGIIGRLIIHIPDVTPLTSLCLFAPTVFPKRQSFFILFLTLLVSDMCLHFLNHYPVFGSWTLFTYSGWIGIAFFGFIFAKKPSLFRALLFTFYASLIFWIWTNFGTWCTTSIYPHTMQGLLACYIAGIPFLKNSVFGSLAWTSVLIILLHYLPISIKSTSYPLVRFQKIRR